MNFVQVYLLTGTAERVIAKLREDVFAHLVHLSPGFFTERRTGELTSRLSADLAVLQTLLGTWISELSRQVAVPRRRHHAADAHASAPHDDDARRGAGGGGLGVLLRKPAAARQHRTAGPGRGQHGHGRRGVLADPHRAELRARGARRRGATARCSRASWTSRSHARRCGRRSSASSASSRSRRRRGAVAGRPAGARRRADGGRARLVPAVCDHGRGGGRARSRRCSAATRKRSARRSACSSCSRWSRPSRSPSGRCRCAVRCAARVALERVRFRYEPELPDVLSDVSLRSRRAKSSRSSGRRARERRRSRR